ncbi:MAG: hypothetical protein J5846_06510, partial [Desulfovibrio sp.]|nr:hypothetical protein [Desulfovibrio sp.]
SLTALPCSAKSVYEPFRFPCQELFLSSLNFFSSEIFFRKTAVLTRASLSLGAKRRYAPFFSARQALFSFDQKKFSVQSP